MLLYYGNIGVATALLIRILTAAPSLLVVIAGVSLTLLRPMVWKYDIDYTPVEMRDALYFDIATHREKNRARSPDARRKYAKPRANGATQVCQIRWRIFAILGVGHNVHISSTTLQNMEKGIRTPRKTKYTKRAIGT